VVLITDAGKNNDLRFREPSAKTLRHSYPVQVWQEQVRQYNVGPEFVRETEAVGAIVRFANHFKVSLRFEKSPQARPNNTVIIDQKNSNGHPSMSSF
jgi:hypothetical protein